jgi:hypothetical protein
VRATCRASVRSVAWRQLDCPGADPGVRSPGGDLWPCPHHRAVSESLDCQLCRLGREQEAQAIGRGGVIVRFGDLGPVASLDFPMAWSSLHPEGVGRRIAAGSRVGGRRFPDSRGLRSLRHDWCTRSRVIETRTPPGEGERRESSGCYHAGRRTEVHAGRSSLPVDNRLPQLSAWR